jgi:hypothetical protein
MRRITLRSLLMLLVIGAFGLLTACSGSGGSTPAGVPVPPPAGQNVQPIAVNGGPLGNYTNGAFVSVNVCVPGTSTCQTIDDVLVDTGSFGLRILASQLTIALTPLTDSSGDQLNDCVQFLDNSFLWGTVDAADVKMAGEVASNTSIQVIANPTAYSIPTSCTTTSTGTGTNEDTQALLGANGIFGVGPEPFDCGSACDPVTVATSGQPPLPYFACSTAIGCNPVPVSCGTLCGDTAIANQQVTNPVFNFSGDNNGVIIELPAVADAAATVNGSMIFGIGTQSNNALGTATVFTFEPQTDNFTTTYKGQAYSNSFIDSGSNGLFFPDATIPVCPTTPVDLSSFYCPPSNLSGLTAINTGANNATNTVTFGVDNTQTLLNNDPADFAFSNLAGPLTDSFDWGLPFFYGRNVYTAIDGTSVGSIAGPFWAY